MKVTIDRFEGEYAVCEQEDKKMIDIKICKIPKGAREGDVLFIENEKIIIDKESTKKMKEETEKLTEDLWE